MTIVFMIAGGMLAAFILSICFFVIWKHPEWHLRRRLGFGLTAVGIIWGGTGRLLGYPIETGDLCLLAGIALLMMEFSPFRLPVWHRKIEVSK